MGCRYEQSAADVRTDPGPANQNFSLQFKKRLFLVTLLIFISRYHIQSFKMQIPKGLRLKSFTHNFLDPRELQRTYWS